MLYLTNFVMIRPTPSNPLGVYALTSTFLSPAELSFLHTILPPTGPYHIAILRVLPQIG